MHRRGLLYLFFLLFSLVALFHARAADAKPSPPFSAALETLQKQIKYDFKAVDLLRRAMTHPSYSRENYRGLSILGLSATQAAVSLHLLQADIDASAEVLNRRISEISASEGCSAAGERLGLQRVVRVSSKTNASAPSVVCGAFRAIFGAVSVDSGEVDVAGGVFLSIYGGGVAAAM